MGRCRIVGVLAGLVLAAVACTATAEPAGSPVPRTMVWERIDPSPGADGPLDVIEFGGRYVGVGGHSAWVSTDLRTWDQVDLGGGGDAVALTQLGGTLVAVGSSGGTEAAIWRSEDGHSWLPVTGTDAPPRAPGYARTSLVAVATAGGIIVAIGTEWGDAGQRPAAWLSDDGRSWERVRDAFDGSSGAAVIGLDEGGFVMAGAGNARAGEVTRTLFWSSADGRSWSVAADDESFGNSQPASLVRLRDGGIVAGGLAVTATGWLKPALWTSRDRLTWTPVAEAPALGPWAAPGPSPVREGNPIQGTTVAALAPTDEGILAAGQRWGLDPRLPRVGGSYEMSWELVAWRSADGISWELLPNDALFALGVSGSFGPGPRHIRQLGRTTVVLGVAPAAGGAVVWLGATPG